MKRHLRRPSGTHLFALVLLTLTSACVYGQIRKSAAAAAPLADDSVGPLVCLVRGKAKALEGTSGMRLGFKSFLAAHQLAPESVRYSDYVIVRLLFEVTRDARGSGTCIGQLRISPGNPLYVQVAAGV